MAVHCYISVTVVKYKHNPQITPSNSGAGLAGVLGGVKKRIPQSGGACLIRIHMIRS